MITLKTLSNKYFPYLVLFSLIVTSYFSISLLQYSFKWDMADQYFPWRYLVGEHLKAGQLPLWNPYQDGGYPMHGDPQSAAWYPIVWLLSIVTGGYTLYTLHVEFILTLFIASIGFYKLSKHLNYSSHTSILLAYAYACSGFFAGNAQHFTWIISGAFLPFIFYYFLKTLEKPSLSDSLKTSLSLFFILSGGYPAFLFIACYILFALLILKIIHHIKYKTFRDLFPLLYHQLIIAIAFLMTSSVVLYSITYCTPIVTRGGSVSLAKAFDSPFTLPSFISFVFPFATCHTTHMSTFDTDVSMANAYFGLILFVLFILFLFKKDKTALEKTLLTIAIVVMSAAIGPVLPIRKFLYDYIPLMNLFRFPSAFRIFFMIFFILLAGSQLEKINTQQFSLKKIKYIWFSILALLLSTLAVSLLKNYSGTGIYDYLFNFSFFDEHCTVYDHVIIQCCTHLFVFISIMLVWQCSKKSTLSLKWIVTILIIADLFIALNLNMKYTLVSKDAIPKNIAQLLQKTPQGFPIPLEKIKSNADTIQDFKPLWKNISIFRKEIAFDGYNPFFLKSYAALETSKLFTASKNNTPVFLASKISNIDQFIDTNALSPQHVFLKSQEFNRIPNHQPIPNTGDTVSITRFTGNSMTLNTNTSQERVMVLFQNNTPGWKAYIDGKETIISTANYALMAVPLTKGKHTVYLNYRPLYLNFFFGLSVLTLIFITSYLTFHFYKSSANPKEYL